jgi:succinate dehydrogenase / fumarate reductase, membrane anchor subunit
VVTRALRQTVGAHYGWKDWLAQRITAVVMAVYTLGLLGIALYHGGIDYAFWQALFGGTAFRISTLLFGLALLWHAWIGVRDIWMDYIKPTGLRLTLEVLTVVLLVAYAGWLVQILWGSR